MQHIEDNKYEYRGVTSIISAEALRDVSEFHGIDLLNFVEKSIDRMLRVAKKEERDFSVGIQIRYPPRQASEVELYIRVFRIYLQSSVASVNAIPMIVNLHEQEFSGSRHLFHRCKDVYHSTIIENRLA